MSKQIAVRLPEAIVAFVDEQVAGGKAESRAVVVMRALERERRRVTAARDVEILLREGDDPDFNAMADFVARTRPDLD